MDRTRARILHAAQALLLGHDGRTFSLDAVARRAGVTRVTVYQHFGSRPRLLEALFDDLARRGGMWELSQAFRQPDPEAALARFVSTFGRFWTVHRTLHRRLRALATLDPRLGRTLDARQEWRRQGLRVIVGRLRAPDATIDALFALTGFETFDLLAGPTRSPAEVAPIVLRIARAALGLLAEPPV